MWSVFTIACGLAGSYRILFVARMGVGAAEACLMPAAWSLIADYFSRARLPRAMSFFLLGPYLGGGLALILGGTVVQALGNPNGNGGIRSEERRIGKEWVSTCKSRWSPFP